MNPIISSVVRWTARGTALLIAVGFLAFAIGEPPGSLRVIPFRDWMGMLLLLAAIVAMLLAWKWEFSAALISMFALAAFAAVVHMHRYDVLLIAAVPDILFLLDWKLRRIHSAAA
jgi:hypothetical protein